MSLFMEYQTRDQISLRSTIKKKRKDDKPFSLPPMQGANQNAAASSEVTIENALDFIKKRLGFVNKKLKLQQQINFMINDLIEKKTIEETKALQASKKATSRKSSQTQIKSSQADNRLSLNEPDSVFLTDQPPPKLQSKQSKIMVISEFDETVLDETYNKTETSEDDSQEEKKA